MRFRVIPCLLLGEGGLVKTRRFKNERYVGDPLNVIRIFNEKEVDELIVLDVLATVQGRQPNASTVKAMAGECFMPLSYGGGVSSMTDLEHLFKAGAEKVVVNAAAVDTPGFVQEAARAYGSQSIAVAMDVRRSVFGRQSVWTHRATRDRSIDPAIHAARMEDVGAGEILLNSVDREGTREGYDLPLVERVSQSVRIPVVASGGAGCVSHFLEAIAAGASAVSAGSMFVFFGKHDAVLITYPDAASLNPPCGRPSS